MKSDSRRGSRYDCTSDQDLASVTLVAALTVIAGIVAIIAGVIAMIAEGTFLGAGLVSVVIGLIYLAVAKGLADGDGLYPAIVAIVSVLQIAWVVYRMIAVAGWSQEDGIGSAVVSLIILLILFSPKANEFFASRSN